MASAFTGAKGYQGVYKALESLQVTLSYAVTLAMAWQKGVFVPACGSALWWAGSQKSFWSKMTRACLARLDQQEGTWLFWCMHTAVLEILQYSSRDLPSALDGHFTALLLDQSAITSQWGAPGSVQRCPAAVIKFSHILPAHDTHGPQFVSCCFKEATTYTVPQQTELGEPSALPCSATSVLTHHPTGSCCLCSLLTGTSFLLE